MKTKYIVTPDNETTQDVNGNYYVDIMQYPIEQLEFEFPPTPHIMGQNEIDRWDLFLTKYYGKYEYSDIVLWINNIQYITRLTSGDTIYMPHKSDLDRFYARYSL